MKRVPAALALITALLLVWAGPGAAATWYVDVGGSGHFLTIQDGIDASSDGDTIVVAAGTYTGNYNYNLRFAGKKIVLISESGPDVTIINVAGWAFRFCLPTNLALGLLFDLALGLLFRFLLGFLLGLFLYSPDCLGCLFPRNLF